MPEYHKIQTLYYRDPKTFKVDPTLGYRIPEIECVDTWTVSEKVDGMNIRIVIEKDDIGGRSLQIFGRTDRAVIPSMLQAHLLSLFVGQVNLLPDSYSDLTIFGEGYGPKINSNPHGLQEPRFAMFDVLVGLEKPYWAPRSEVRLLAKTLGVPMVAETSLTGSAHVMADFVRRGEIGSSVGTNGYCEGIVCRPSHELFTQRGERIIFKVKRKDFA